MKYFVWESEYTKGFCALDGLEGVDREFELRAGISRTQGWPSDASCGMQKDFPKDVQIPDNVYGAYHVVVSNRTKDILQAGSSNRVEFLPITIRNHKNRVASTDHCLVNALDVCDCIDLDKSGVSWNDVDPTAILGVDQLVLNRSAIPGDYTIFRPKHWKILTVAREDLVMKLRQTGLTGLKFVDFEDYEG